MDQIAVTGDRALDLAAEVGGTVERLLNGLHGEVGVATIDDLKDKDLPSLSGYFLSLHTNSRTMFEKHCHRTQRGWTIT